MKATDASLLTFIRKAPQFMIPIYQRSYSWTDEECKQLWEDLLRAGRSPHIPVHFLGSVVYVAHIPQSIAQVAIVENTETFFGYDPVPGVCLFFGSGNAVTGMASEIVFLKERRVVYWGDLDSFGIKILSRLRRAAYALGHDGCGHHDRHCERSLAHRARRRSLHRPDGPAARSRAGRTGSNSPRQSPSRAGAPAPRT